MGKKFGTNSKAEEGRARKAAIADEKKRQAAAKKEAEEAKSWEQGTYKNKKKEEEESKRLERLAKKKAREEQERKEQAELDKYKSPRNAPATKSPGILRVERSIAVDALRNAASDISANKSSDNLYSPTNSSTGPLESYSASNLDDALSLMESLTVETATATIDRHPERRMKAAYAAFEEREMPILKAENPELRLSQLKERLFRMWQKSPDNPFNQAHIAHTATRDEERVALREQSEQSMQRFRMTPPP